MDFLDEYTPVKMLNSNRDSEVYVVHKGDPKILFLLKTIRHKNQIQIKKRFYSEINTVTSFDHPNIAKPIDARLEKESLYLIYPYDDGTTLKELFDEKKYFDEIKSLLIIKQLLEALLYVHTRGIIHADINPSNIYISKEFGCKLIDFGYSLNIDEIRTVSEGQIIGTFPYLSPEQIGFTDFKIDSRTDTYCIAVLLYQLLSGSLPFSMTDESIKGLLDANLKREVPAIKHIPKFLNEILLKGLKPTPGDRYQTAEGMLHDVVTSIEIISRGGDFQFVAGKKDAFLGINRKRMFVVRQNEIKQLHAGVQKLTEHGSFSVVIYGKSGIGKTELIREFKKTVDSKIDFIAAKSNRFTPNQPYSIYRQIFLEIVNKILKLDAAAREELHLVIQKNLQEYSGVICQIIPEASVLFENILDIEQIDKEKEFDRVIFVLTKLISTLCSTLLTIIYIDDFQWTDKITLKIILNLIELKVPCMIICNYRTADNDIGLLCHGYDLRNVGFDQLVNIQEFTKDDTGQLITAKFKNVVNSESLVDIIQSKTDGVPYLISEALRYLIYYEILIMRENEWLFKGEMAEKLPEKFDAVSLVLNNVSQLNREEKYVLQVASLIEGKFDETMLEDVIVIECVYLKVIISKIEALGFITNHLYGGFTFSHDKIQESISNDIPKNDKTVIYGKLGRLFFEKSKTNSEKLVNAAEYYLKSTDMILAVNVCYQAAEYALKKSALDVAIKYLKNVSLLLEYNKNELLGVSVDSVKVGLMLGDVLMLTGANEQALSIFANIIVNKNISKLDKLEVEYKIGSIYHNISEFELSSKYFIQSLKANKIIIPQKRSILILSIIVQIAIQFVMSMGGAKLIPLRKDKKARIILKILNKLSYSLYFSDMVKGYFVHFKALNLADRLFDCSEKAETYTLHQVPVYQMMLKKRAFKYLKKTQKISKKIKRIDDLAFSESFGGMIYYYNSKWRHSEDLLNNCINKYSSIGDINNQIPSREHLWKIKFIKGAIGAAIDEMNETIYLCKKVKEKYFLLVTLSAINLCKLFKSGQHDYGEYIAIQEQLKSIKPLLFHTEIGGYLLNVEIVLGEYKSAYSRATQLLPMIIKNSINSEYQVRGFYLFGYLIVSELLGRMQGNFKLDVPTVKLKLLFVFSSFVHWFSCLCYPAYWGSFYRNIAWFAAIHKCNCIAQWFFNRAIRSHHKQDMRFEEACSIRDFGIFKDDCCNQPGNARDQFINAYEIFKWCGAKFETDRLDIRIHPEKSLITTIRGDTDLVRTAGSTSSGVNLIRFETLVDVSKTITETDDPAILLRQILSAMITATGAQYGYLFINKNVYEEFEPIAMSFEGKQIPIADVPIFKDLIDKVNDIHTLQCTGETDLDDTNETDSAYIRSDLCVPLNWRDKYLGYVYLVNDRVRGLFGEGAQKAAMVLAAHAGILLENANLISKQKQFNVELQRQVDSQTDDLKQKHQQLEVANLRLVESERMKGILSGTLVHDIKNYAAGITGNLLYLDRRLENDPKAHRIIDVVCETCIDITSLASNLLDIAKMDDGKMIVREEPLDYDFFEAMAEKFGRTTLFEEKGIVPGIQPLTSDFGINADVYLMERVLQNLYSNASKYAPKGSVVELRLYSENDEDIICFFNSGPPIPDSEKVVLFEKYARIQTRQSPYSKGLGLFFCRMVMHAHGGRIWLDTDDEGNYFKLAFPRKPQFHQLKAAS